MIGEAIGNFVVVSRLGRGGMGEVFLAKHKELDTPVAVKVLNEDISEDRDHVQRFFNEARVVSRIKHAGTIKIFDSGFIKGHAYLVMELLEGQSLSDRLRDHGPMPIPQVLDVARQIASVLDATHRSGVIHRDLKPDNIYLVGDDERASGERVKVLDFGIAKLSGTLASSSPKTSGTMGTPAYMAPEQWGDSGQVDWRADVYSLGCVIFELACGRPPFVAATIPEAYTKHVHTKPSLPSTLEPAVPPELDELIMRLLAKDPSERAVSMGQVVRELEALATGTTLPSASSFTRPSTPVAAVTLTTLGGSASEVQDAPPQRRSVALIAGVAAAAALVVVVVVVIAMTRSSSPVTPPPPEPAVAPAPPAPASPALPATVPLVAPPDAAPPPVDAAPPPPPADAARPPPDAPPVRTKKKPPVVIPHAGSGAKPSDDDPMGGRL